MELENEADRGKNQIIPVEKAIYPHTGRWLQTGDLGINLISQESPPRVWAQPGLHISQRKRNRRFLSINKNSVADLFLV